MHCNTCKCAQHDHCCRRAVKPHSFIHFNNIVVDDEEYEGTPGLWELTVSKNPDGNIYTNDDYDNYARLMLKTNNNYPVRDKNGK